MRYGSPLRTWSIGSKRATECQLRKLICCSAKLPKRGAPRWSIQNTHMFAKSTNTIYPVAEVVSRWLLEQRLSGYQTGTEAVGVPLLIPFDSFGYRNLPREGVAGGFLSGGPPAKTPND